MHPEGMREDVAMSDDKPTKQAAVRWPTDLLARVEALAAAERRGRSSALITLVEDALPAREAAAGIGRPVELAAPVAASSTRSERAAKRGDGHAYSAGANLRCKVCGVTQARHS